MRLFNNAIGIFLLATGAMLLAPVLPASAQIPPDLPQLCSTDADCSEPDLQFCFILICVECLIDGHCDDGLFCNGEEECGINGSCFDGTPPCPAGLACDEANDSCEPCASDDDCNALDGPCTEGVCDKGTGTCDSEPANDGGACDDGNDCTDNVCADGVCGSTDNTADCDDGDDCTTD
ncbi:MAG: hypothetical protein IIA66_13130, partial [Planctomycetes bacterium]|nr:hypothetical protein [Planctomycetota bacterium]